MNGKWGTTGQGAGMEIQGVQAIMRRLTIVYPVIIHGPSSGR